MQSIDIIEIKYKCNLEINDVVPEAQAQHEESLLENGWQAVRVHAFIIGSAGTIGKSLHTILTTWGLAKSETRQRLLNSKAYNSVVRTARIVRLRSHHFIPHDVNTPPDVTGIRSTPTEDPPSTSRTSTAGSRPDEDPPIPPDVPDTCVRTLPLM